MRYLRFFLAAVAAIAAAAVLAGTAAAETETFKAVIPFSSPHPCTAEPVEGDARVHVVITTTENPDCSTHVRIHQQTHGQSLVGAVSGDEYVFNNGEDAITDVDFFGETGRVVTRTEFIHRGEDVAFSELPGLDDFHQRLIVTVSPLLPPTIERERGECR